MKQLLLMIAVVMLVGCGKKEDGNTGAVKPNLPSPEAVPEKLITDPNVEKAIREKLEKPEGELTEADYEQLEELSLFNNKLTEVPKGLENLTQLKWLHLYSNQLTDVKGLEKFTKLKSLHLQDNQLTSVKGLEKLTQLTYLNLEHNPDLTKAQIDELQKALPKCKISSNPTK